jgi:hypothetical protein
MHDRPDLTDEKKHPPFEASMMTSTFYCPESHQAADVAAVLARVAALLAVQQQAVSQAQAFVARSEQQVADLERELDPTPRP